MTQRTVTAYLGLGSSLGDRLANLRDALRRLGAEGTGVRITALSPVYESPHMGLEPGDETRFPPHLNVVVEIVTTLAPEKLLLLAQTVEAAGGRTRDRRWGPRSIDVDLLVYNSVSMRTENLILPHPGLIQRAFVVVPLADIAPDLRLPDGRTVRALLQTETIRSQKIERVHPDELAVT